MSQTIDLRPWDPPRGDPPGTLEETRSVREVFGVAHPPGAAGPGQLGLQRDRGQRHLGSAGAAGTRKRYTASNTRWVRGPSEATSPDPPVTAGLPRAPGTRVGVCPRGPRPCRGAPGHARATHT